MVDKLKSFADKHVERFISRKFGVVNCYRTLCVWNSNKTTDSNNIGIHWNSSLVDMAVKWKHGSSK